MSAPVPAFALAATLGLANVAFGGVAAIAFVGWFWRHCLRRQRNRPAELAENTGPG